MEFRCNWKQISARRGRGSRGGLSQSTDVSLSEALAWNRLSLGQFAPAERFGFLIALFFFLVVVCKWILSPRPSLCA